MQFFVGCSGLPDKRSHYFETLNAVEVLPDQEVPPNPSRAQRWREEAPEDFCFCLVASRLFTSVPDRLPPGLGGKIANYGGLQLTDEVLSLYQRTMEAALAMKARTLVFITPPKLGPSRRGREALERFFSKVDRHGLRFAWEPHGPWDNDEIIEICSELNLVRCVDPLRDQVPEGDAVYVRLGPFAVMGRSLADDELEWIVEVMESFDEAYCFFNTERAFSDARRLREMSL